MQCALCTEDQYSAITTIILNFNYHSHYAETNRTIIEHITQILEILSCTFEKNTFFLTKNIIF